MKNSFLRPEPVGEPAEEHGAQHRAGEVGAAGEPDVGVAELEDRALLERAGHGAGQRHLQAVENPGDAERDHDERVEAAPRQAVEPRRECRSRRRRTVWPAPETAVWSRPCIYLPE